MRTNRDWLRELRAAPPSPEAITALRRYLVRGLASGLRDQRVSEADLEDFAQSALVRVLDRLDSFRGDSQLTTWALSIALRLAFTELRRKRWKDVSLDGYTLPPEPEVAPTAHQELEKEQLHRALREAIRTVLTDRQRTLILAELQGVAGVVLAEKLGAKPGSLYKMYHDARRKLRAALVEQGFDAALVSSLTEGASNER